jgi:inosine-uridine nucleoside N-ribohydrolase
MRHPFVGWIFGLLAMVSSVPTASAAPGAIDRTPVIFDTDIGTDIDDAYALALLMQRPELEVLGVTTVSSDAVARARLAAKLLHVAGGRWARVPVYAGISTSIQYMQQVEWAQEFASPSLHVSGGVDFMRREVNRRPGEITIIAVGELTNIAALLEAEPGIGRKIRAISLMGGSIYRGFGAGSKPEPEWNIKSNAAAARAVFGSGVRLLVAPLDSTADLKMTAEMRVTVFKHGTAVNDALAALNSIWRHTNHWHGENPTFFDLLAVQLVEPRKPYALTPLHIDIGSDGRTEPVAGGLPNAEIALEVDAASFMAESIALLSR